jgi:hypothetical protein
MSNTILVSSPKGPRFSKLKYTHKISTKELFEDFQKRYPEYDIDLKEFEHIWLDLIAPEIQKEAALNPLGIKLPFYVGELKLQWLPYRPKEIDFNHKDRQGEIVPLLNLMNGGKVPKLKWERRNAVRYNRWLQFYGFTPSREIEKLAKKKIEENPNDLRVSRVTLGGAKYGLAPLKK